VDEVMLDPSTDHTFRDEVAKLPRRNYRQH
jgi:hypothetical protein